MTATEGDLLSSLAAIKARLDRLTQERAEIEAALVLVMQNKGQKSVSVSLPTGTVRGTLVEGVRVIIDESKLKDALSAPMWKKVTRAVLDKEKLEAHVVTGDIDANIVAAASEEKPSKPYIRVSGDVYETESTGTVTGTNSAGGTKPAAKRVRAKKAGT